MYNNYYKSIIQKLIDLKQKGHFSHINIQDSFIDPKLDILLRSFSFIAEEIDDIMNFTKLKIKLEMLLLHYPFLMRTIVSKLIIVPYVNFETSSIFVANGYEFQAYEKEQTFFYRNCYDAVLIPIERIETKIDHADKFDIRGDVGDFFIKISIFFLKDYCLSVCKVRSIRFLLNCHDDNIASKLMLSMHNDIIYIYAKQDNILVKVGHIKTMNTIDLDDQGDVPLYILNLLNYFHFPKILYILDFYFDIDDPSNLFLKEQMEIFISIKYYVKANDCFITNFLVLTNIKYYQSNMITFCNSLTQAAYLDYINRDVLKIYQICHLYSFNMKTAKKNTVQNFINYKYDTTMPIIYNVYWSHRRNYDKQSKQFSEYIDLDCPNLNIEAIQEITDNLQFYYLAKAYQVIERKINIGHIICITNNKILFKQVIFGPTFSQNINCNNMKILDNLFIIYNADLIHSISKRGVIVNIFNSLAYLFSHNLDYDRIIGDVTLSKEFLETVIHHQYTSNVILYKINIYVNEPTNVRYEFYKSLSQFIIGMFGITIRTHIVFYNNKENTILYHEYSHYTY